MPRWRLLLAVGLLAALVLAAVLLPVPGPAELRAWASNAGAAAALLMFATYVVATIAPLPRTVFTLASGMLLGPVLGTVVAMSAATVSAAIGFGLARWLGRGMVAKHLDRAAVRTADARLTDGGWLAVASLRLIPVIPFTPLSYCCGLSSVRIAPYLTGTVLGSLPGTLAVVLFGDTLTGATSPEILIVSAACAVLGALGLLIAIRRAGRTGKSAAATEPPTLLASNQQR